MRATRPVTQVDVETRIRELSDALEAGVDDYAEVRRRLANAVADYRAAHARAVLTSPGRNAEERKARADHACAELHRVLELTQAEFDIVKEAQFALRARLDAERTLAANLRGVT